MKETKNRPRLYKRIEKMAKMFYSFEEVQEKLALNADQIKHLIDDGKLREFRDGAKIMFKVDEVDQLFQGVVFQYMQSGLIRALQV